MKFSPRCVASLLIGFATLQPTFALPAMAASQIEDNAGMFSASMRERAESRIQEIERASGLSVEIVTSPTIAGTSLREEASLHLERNQPKSVVLYVARSERKLTFKASPAAKILVPADVQMEIREVVTERFREDAYDEGLDAGLDRLESALGQASKPSTQFPAPIQEALAFSLGALAAGLALLVSVGGALILAQRRAYQRVLRPASYTARKSRTVSSVRFDESPSSTMAPFSIT